MPPTIDHLPLLRKRKWEMVYFLSLHPIDSYCSGGARGAYGTQTEQQASKHGIASCFGPAARRRGEKGGRPPEKSPNFRRKIPVFRHKAPIFAGGKGEKRQKMHFSFM